MVAGAVFALWWAIRRLRRDGDPTNLALWFATVIYLFVIEIPLYFPDIFGSRIRSALCSRTTSFTVQFLFERLPLYIVALYPAVVTLAYEIVRSLGVFRDRGVMVGAICVGFVHHCFYEVFDQLGPAIALVGLEHRQPAEPSVPGFGADDQCLHLRGTRARVVTLLVMLLVGRGAHAGCSSVAGVSSWRTFGRRACCRRSV